MRKARSLVLSLLTLAGMLTGCNTQQYRVAEVLPRDIVVLDSYPEAVEKWKLEAQRRFNEPIVISCHGFTHNGEWYCAPQVPNDRVRVETLAKTLHQLCPNNDIVLIICNPDGKEIHVPRVWYAKSNVWVLPNRYAYPWDQLSRVGNNNVGTIEEFVN